MIVIKLNEVMGKQRLKISDVMTKTRLARNTVADLYNGTAKRVDLETLDKLCTALDCSLEDILEHKKEMIY
jgi:putative transcriptional regulator